MLICSQSYNLSYMKQTLLGNGYRIVQAPVVKKVNSGIHRINQYTVDNTIGFVNTYPLDSDLSGGSRYPPFEQPRSVRSLLSFYCEYTGFTFGRDTCLFCFLISPFSAS